DDDGPLALFLQGAAVNNCSPGFRSAANRRQLLFLPVTPFLTSTNGNQYYCGEIAPAPIALNTDTLDLPAPGGLFNPPPIGPRDGTAFDGVETQEWFTSLKLDWDIGGSGWVLTSTSGYRDYVNLFGTDSDHSDAFAIGAIPSFFPPPPRVVGYAPGEPLFANTNRNDIVDYSSELRIASPVDRRLRGVLGLYYYDQKDEGRDLTFEYPRRAELENESFTENQAIFGLLAYDITDRLTATVEIRYAEETKERDDYCDSLAGCTNTQFGDVGFGEKIFSAEETFTATDPRVTIDYQVTPDALLYGVYAKGSKPGGINGSVGLPVDAVFYEQEESDNFELGAKVSGLDGRVQFNTALFYIDATDVQLTTALPATTGQGAVNSVATNQGAAEIKGLEIDMQALLTDNLVLGLGYAYTNAKFTEGCDDFEHVLNTGGVIIDFANLTPEAREACDISGNRLPLGSEHQANATLDWVVPFGSSGYEFVSNLNATYESSKFVQVHNLAETGDATIVGLRLGVRSPSGWQVTAWGRNLTDEDTIPLATRWFDLRYGFANTAPPGTAGTSPGLLDSGLPRAFFGALRKGRTFGVDFRYEF
ncbi:MAG TPA: TonB-dependent receptor, partial [Steroidobacteraceae bacterium]|nr:TonB-dependent receptor [Steroidobacteraceae bacterium]